MCRQNKIKSMEAPSQGLAFPRIQVCSCPWLPSAPARHPPTEREGWGSLTWLMETPHSGRALAGSLFLRLRCCRPVLALWYGCPPCFSSPILLFQVSAPVSSTPPLQEWTPSLPAQTSSCLSPSSQDSQILSRGKVQFQIQLKGSAESRWLGRKH